MGRKIGDNFLHSLVQIALRCGVGSGEYFPYCIFVAIVIREQFAILVLGESAQTPVGFKHGPEVGLRQHVVKGYLHGAAGLESHAKFGSGNQVQHKPYRVVFVFREVRPYQLHGHISPISIG